MLSSALQVDVALYATRDSTRGSSDGGKDGDSQTERGQVAGNSGHADTAGGLQTAHLQVSAAPALGRCRQVSVFCERMVTIRSIMSKGIIHVMGYVHVGYNVVYIRDGLSERCLGQSSYVHDGLRS